MIKLNLIFNRFVPIQGPTFTFLFELSQDPIQLPLESFSPTGTTMSNPFTISQTDIDTTCSQLEPDPNTIPQIDKQDDENADTNQKTRQTTLSFVPSAMAYSRRTILRRPLDRGYFRQRSDGNNVFVDKIMQGYTPFLLELVRQQRLILKSEEVDQDILFGDPAKRHYANKETKQILDLLLEEATGSKRPGIYCNSIGRISDGSASSRNEMMVIIDKMQAYIDNSDHEYLEKPVWRVQIERFIPGIKNRLLRYTFTDPDSPMESAILEFGYDLYIPDRLKAHRSHTDSNYIINLFESICHVMWPRRFRLHQFATFLVVTLDEAATAEMVLTLCRNGSGQSSSKAFQLFKRLMTAEFFEWSTKNGPLEANIAAWEREDNNEVDEASEKTEDMSNLNELVVLEEEATTGMSESSRQEGVLNRCDEVDTVVNGYE
ncbi:hypothetical protein D6D01_02019 [Aureobasidium pullulans]|uniref:Uncharacterized protein n=1 Tax=Aureobasidium pullulans TaxID=5580 RepID=A0A4S9LY51_AURPU|nr:hypothetical protein D6D01_02019 [Aureobasidium pullulans]